jgi:hypothetical protein
VANIDPAHSLTVAKTAAESYGLQVALVPDRAGSQEHGLAVLAFVRPDRYTIYTGAERIRQATAAPVPTPVRRIPPAVVYSKTLR